MKRVPRSARHRGFTLVEVLIAVAILSMLLLATTAALQASIDSFSANQASADTLLRGRLTMMRISQQIRAGSDHLPITLAKQTGFIAGATVTDTGVSFQSDVGEEVNYMFDSASSSLKVSVDGGTSRTLASNVSAFAVKLTPTRSATSIKTGGIFDELERANITLTLIPNVDGEQIVGQTLVLSESVTPRARLWN